MKFASVCVVLATLAIVVLATATDVDQRVGTDTVINTTGGPVRGVFDAAAGVYYWKGVPYAASTGGANRFRSPQPVVPWTSVRDATKWGPGCYQYKVNPDAPAQQSEDCLLVNVFTPATSNRDGSSALLPVMVWIHGGGFLEGSNIGPYEVYDGRYVAARSNVVVISINYRLGALGFMVGGSIGGNMGFLDQVAALHWVQANAAAFGGDKAQVTLWGESAGAMSIGLHMISPLSKGLFVRAIQESNPLAILYKDTKGAKVLGEDTCKRAGCKGCDLKCMQAVPIANVLAQSKAAAASMWNTVEANYRHILGALLDFTPVMDGTIIPQQVIPALMQGKYTTNVPLITGTNLQEGQTFVYSALSKPLSKLVVEAGLVLIWPFHAKQMLDRYTQSGDTDGREPLSRVVTDFLFTCPSQQFGVALRKRNVPAYVYQYQHVFSIPSLFKGLIPDRCATAVCHATELPIVFHNGPVNNGVMSPLTSAENTLSDSIIDYFGNFAHTGNPNKGKAVSAPWPMFDAVQRNVLVLGGSGAPGTVLSFKQTCERWDSIGYGTGALRFRAVSEAVSSDEDEVADEQLDEVDAEDEAEAESDVESEDEAEDEVDAESDAEADAEDAEEMEDFVADAEEAERYEFADA